MTKALVADQSIHPHTACAWAQYAQNSWAEYLEAAQATEQRRQACVEALLDPPREQRTVPALTSFLVKLPEPLDLQTAAQCAEETLRTVQRARP